MAGIYIHVPFCKTRCIYCDFYSTTRSEWKGRYIEALCKELEMRYTYLKGKPIETLYFGGGTPTAVNNDEFEEIMSEVYDAFVKDKKLVGFPESIRHRPPNLWDGELP